MYVNSYFYEHGTIDCGDRVKIEGLEDSSIKHTSKYYIDKFKNKLQDIRLEGKVAFLYAAGPATHTSEKLPLTPKFNEMSLRIDSGPAQLAVQETVAFMAHLYLKVLNKNNEISFFSMNANTCASSMFSFYEAYQLLHYKDFDHVIIISEERTRPDTIRSFNELNINLKLGEGFGCIILSNVKSNNKISDCKWEYLFNNNPFKSVEEGYRKIYTDADHIKIHGTLTSANDSAEEWLYTLNKHIIGYKNEIGHTQGASFLIEMCKVLDDTSITGTICCMASGLGNVYGSALLTKS